MSEFYDNDERNGRIPVYNDFSRSRHIGKTKKEYLCESCERAIPAGSSCQYWVGILDRKFYYYRLCYKCLEE
jgi:hypothetical protein